MLLATLLVAACENEPSNDYASMLKLAENEVEFGKNGGTERVKFTIDNAQGGTVTAVENIDWLDAVVEYNSEVVITVDTNTGEAREGIITLEYEYAKSVVITVKQRAENIGECDVEFVAKRFEGVYFGTDSSSVPNYYVILSDIGANSDVSPKANGTYYFFDMYHATAADEEWPILPKGDYTYDATNNYANLTFSEEGSWYAVMNAAGEYEKSGSFKNANISVTNGKFEAYIELTSGETHKVTFEGTLLTLIGHIRSTFTEDVEFAVADATITASLYGDITGTGAQNWFIEAKSGNDLFMVEVFSENAMSYDGLYQALADDSTDYMNRYLPGVVGEDGLVGTWYAKLTDGVIKGDVMAPMCVGLIRLNTVGDVLTIEYGCKDDADNNITGTVSGTVTIKDMRE